MAKKQTKQTKQTTTNQGREIATLKERTDYARGMLQQNMGEITKALAKTLDPVQFLRICMTTYQRGGDKMAKCDPRSFVAACVEAAQLGLKPDGILGECYLIPRGGVVCLQLGYPGLIKLARRGGEVSEIVPEVAYENDKFEVTLGTDRKIVHLPWYTRGKSESGEVIAAYATARLSDGSIVFKVVPLPELHKAAEASGDSRDKKWSSVWRDHFDPMAMKTAAIRLCKWLPMSDDSKRAIKRDEQREAGLDDEDLREIIAKMSTQVHRTDAAPSRGGRRSLDDLVNESDPDPAGTVTVEVVGDDQSGGDGASGE